MKNIILATSLMATVSLPVFAETAFVQSLDLAQYRTDVKTLASDAFGGRAPLSEGETLTLDYLVTAFKDMGLKPGFGDSYLQAVPLAKISADQNMQLDIGGLKFANGSEFTARTQRIADTVSLKYDNHLSEWFRLAPLA